MIPKEVLNAYFDYMFGRITKKEYQTIYAKYVVFLNKTKKKGSK